MNCRSKVTSQLIPMSRAVALLIALAIPTLAQDGAGRPGGDAMNAERARQQDQSRRELQLRNLEAAPSNAPDRKQIQAAMDEVDHDFKRILTLHNEIVRTVSTEKVTNYNFVSEATAEIRKRASHLQTVLKLPKPDASARDQEKHFDFANAEVKDALIMLCKEIKSFVTNPIIETPGTVDPQQLIKARRDLESIIELSGSIKRTAERLNKLSN